MVDVPEEMLKFLENHLANVDESAMCFLVLNKSVSMRKHATFKPTMGASGASATRTSSSSPRLPTIR